ncbi:uncharacterized protein BDV14DRAFT_41387 [Aspergillus stella-maris]|uniref:uncharacterized protein n=1 Tax=Aspergillus stella-maris TaxID=1810926 RepID=UPI003CCCBE96
MDAFQRTLPNLNLFQMVPDLPTEVDLLDPISFSRFRYIRDTIHLHESIVYKQGSSTDLTVGHFTKLVKQPPRGWYDTDRRILSGYELDLDE